MPIVIPPFNNVPAPEDPITSAWAQQLTQYAVDHVNDTNDAHDATAISFVPTATISATNVQSAIEELASEAGGGGGGTGTPGGSNHQVQYNNAGAFGGASLIEILGGNLLLKGATVDPGMSADGPVLFVKKFGNASILCFKTPGTNRRAIVPPMGWAHASTNPRSNGTATSNTSLGCTSGANGGNVAAIDRTLTNRHTRATRYEVLVASPATNAAAGWRMNDAGDMCGMGTGTEGGFLFALRWGPATGVSIATHRYFAGMGPSIGSTDIEPSTRTSIAGMGWDAADANVQFMHNSDIGNATKIDLGASFPVPSIDRTAFYELLLYAPVAAAEVSYLVTDLNTGAEAQGVATTDTPVSTIGLRPNIFASVGGTNSVIGIAVMGADLWTPY